VSTSKLAPDWLHMSEQPIRRQVSKLAKLLTVTQTHKFPLQELYMSKKMTKCRLFPSMVSKNEIVVYFLWH